MKTTLLSFILFSISVCLNAQSGTLDSTFGQQGKLLQTTSRGLPWPVNSVIIKKDGNILVGSGEATSFLLKQFLNNGTNDSSFGNAGEVRTRFKNYLGAYTTAVSLTKDNKIIAVGIGDGGIGTHNSDILLAKYSTNGRPDSSFGVNGTVAFDLNLIEVINCMEIANEGKILVAGYCAVNDEEKSNCFLARFNSNGTLDTNFGDSGKVITDVGSPYQSYINSIVLTPNNDIIAAGYAQYIPNTSQNQILLAKFDMNGKIKTDFGTNGLVFTSVGTDADYAYSVALQDDGKIVTAGAANYKFLDSSAMVVVRYNSDGSIDKSFNSTGSLSIFFGENNARAKALTIQPNGDLLLSGSVAPDLTSPPNYEADFGLVSITKDGIIDSAFGVNGRVITDFSGLEDECDALAIQQDGKIIAAGGSTDVTNTITYITLARYNNNLSKKQIIINKIKHYIQTHNNADATNNKLTTGNINVYPNPVTSLLTVEGLKPSVSYDLLVMNEKGSVVNKASVSSNTSYKFNVQYLSGGVYYLSVTSNQKIISVLKFVKL